MNQAVFFPMAPKNVLMCFLEPCFNEMINVYQIKLWHLIIVENTRLPGLQQCPVIVFPVIAILVFQDVFLQTLRLVLRLFLINMINTCVP